MGCRAIARFEEGIPNFDRVTRGIMGGPEGQFDLLFPLTDKIMYYASVFSLPEVLPIYSALDALPGIHLVIRFCCHCHLLCNQEKKGAWICESMPGIATAIILIFHATKCPKTSCAHPVCPLEYLSSSRPPARQSALKGVAAIVFFQAFPAHTNIVAVADYRQRLRHSTMKRRCSTCTPTQGTLPSNSMSPYGYPISAPRTSMPTS